MPFELELLAAQGFVPFSLGPRALRVDVATVAALAQIELKLLRPAAPGWRGPGPAHHGFTPSIKEV